MEDRETPPPPPPPPNQINPSRKIPKINQWKETSTGKLFNTTGMI